MEEQILEYDAFISYKRQGGLGWAELVNVQLTSAGKRIYIDYYVASGTQHPLISSLKKEIDKSMNVIVVIFEGIQEVIKPKQDIFLQELQYAIKTKKNIIPFYVDGLSSSLIKTEERFKNLPTVIKKIASVDHSDICYVHDSSHDWAGNLINSFDTEEVVRMKTQYLVLIQPNEDTTLIVPGIKGSENICAGNIKSFWVNSKKGFQCEVSIHSDDEQQKLTYRLVVDPKSTEPYLSGYKQRQCLKKEKKVLFYINWQLIKQTQLQAKPTLTDII